MIADATLLIGLAEVNVTLAGFSGLVAAFRRGGETRTMDLYRLRQIAEFGLANVILVLATIPLANTLEDISTTTRIASAAALAYMIVNVTALLRRQRRLQLTQGRALITVVAIVDLVIIGLALATMVVGALTAYEWLLVALLIRPILAFTFVLGDVTRTSA